MQRNRIFSNGAKYTGTAMALHWLVALLIVCGFAIGWVMTEIHGRTPFKSQLFDWHKWIGLTVFVLVVLRVLWRATHRPPPLPASVPIWQRGVAHAVHALLYLLIIAIPLSGYIFNSAGGHPIEYLGVLPIPLLVAPDKAVSHLFRNIHVYLNWLMFWVVLLHVLGALKHQLIDRDGLIGRMLPFGRGR